jgi:hypothetical protein
VVGDGRCAGDGQADDALLADLDALGAAGRVDDLLVGEADEVVAGDEGAVGAGGEDDSPTAEPS